MIKTSDFIFKYLVEKYNIKDAFLIVGGGAMHLNDSIGKTKGLSYICNHHEQASAICAEGYYRSSGNLCVVNVTTGPGGTNAITGVLGQWFDSIPAIYISGQIKQSTCIQSYPNLKLRQLGDQEADIVNIVKPITKYAVMIKDANEIQYHLDKAMYLALNGRPGPVWIDVPLDIQGELIDENNLKQFDEKELQKTANISLLQEQTDILLEKIKKAKSPVIYVGNGVRLAKREQQFLDIIKKLGIPTVTAISGSDLLWEDHPLYFGRPGICGDRIGNIMVQNSDLLIIIGTRLSIRQVGYAYEKIAPKAYKVMVDIDEAELNKPTLSIDLKINNDIKDFLDVLEQRIERGAIPSFEKWIDWGFDIKKEVPTLFDDNPSIDGFVSSYVFADELFNQLQSGDIVVTANGTAYTSTYQAMKIKKGVRVFANQGCASMGYDLPAAIGAAVANPKSRIVCIAGDGSIQMNLQELQTIVSYNLPIKIFILENESYLAIKTTQKSFFDGHIVGSDPSSGVICPNMSRIAQAYDIPYTFVSEEGKKLKQTIEKTLNAEKFAICEIKTDPWQSLCPKAASFMDENGKMDSAPLEKMYPFMSEEMQKRCIYQ
jgi:acetolactate synthase-1/2/3 large subunit